MAAHGMIRIQSFVKIGSSIQVIFKVITSTICEAVVLVLLIRIYGVPPLRWSQVP
jgi:hypothetical protein